LVLDLPHRNSFVRKIDGCLLFRRAWLGNDKLVAHVPREPLPDQVGRSRNDGVDHGELRPRHTIQADKRLAFVESVFAQQLHNIVVLLRRRVQTGDGCELPEGRRYWCDARCGKQEAEEGTPLCATHLGRSCDSAPKLARVHLILLQESHQRRSQRRTIRGVPQSESVRPKAEWARLTTTRYPHRENERSAVRGAVGGGGGVKLTAARAK
jgi:hypothetical protein